MHLCLGCSVWRHTATLKHPLTACPLCGCVWLLSSINSLLQLLLCCLFACMLLVATQGYADLSDAREDFYNRRMYRRIHVSDTCCSSMVAAGGWVGPCKQAAGHVQSEAHKDPWASSSSNRLPYC